MEERAVIFIIIYLSLGNLVSIHVLQSRASALDLHSDFVILLICMVSHHDSSSVNCLSTLVQAVFDFLFLVFANLVYSVTAILLPNRVDI